MTENNIIDEDILVELYAIDIIEGYNPDKSIIPPSFKERIEAINKAKKQMELCSFDSDDELWNKAREFAQEIVDNFTFKII